MGKKYLLFDIDGTLQSRNIFVIGNTTADIDCGRAIHATTIGMISEFEPGEKLKTAATDYLLDDYRPLFDLWQLPYRADNPKQFF